MFYLLNGRKLGESMIEIKGKYNTAKVFTDNVESEAIAQITELCNQEFVKDSVIRIMPDTHAGAGCTIGTTMTISDKIVPNLVGVDIGCGMETIRLKQKEIDFEKLDKVIYDYIPSGFDIRKKQHKYAQNIDFDSLACKKHVNLERARLSIGTLGGGNHFIEVNKDRDGTLYLVVHSGSRHLGKQVAEYYQELAYK
jgi:RNA-splicing ligase RtcB